MPPTPCLDAGGALATSCVQTGFGGRPVVLFMPARDEAATVASLVERAPEVVCGHPVRVLVVDDGSGDATASLAAAAGARVVSHSSPLGLGAAARTGLDAAVEIGAVAVAFCDADGEYAPEELERLVAPILDGRADYVAGSRFAGGPRRMRAHRALGNRALTLALRMLTREPITDGQSGYRAFSPAAAAAAEIPHDYNYAQVLTIDLLAKGFRYAEVPITYAHREYGRSFVRLPTYLRHVLPTVAAQMWRMRRGGTRSLPARTRTSNLTGCHTRFRTNASSLAPSSTSHPVRGG